MLHQYLVKMFSAYLFCFAVTARVQVQDSLLLNDTVLVGLLWMSNMVAVVVVRNLSFLLFC